MKTRINALENSFWRDCCRVTLKDRVRMGTGPLLEIQLKKMLDGCYKKDYHLKYENKCLPHPLQQ